MPWHVSESGECPASRPWAVIRDSNGAVEGCHQTEAAAKRQMAALYAQERGASMRHKTFQLVETKASDSGSFTALASVFGNVDVVGDRMMKGAFRKTLEKWRESGDPIPVILSHQWDDPMAMVGKADPNQVTETDDGLVVEGQLDISDNPVAKQVHKLMKERLLKGWSFGYTVPTDGEKVAEDGANEVYEVDLIEVGPTLKGANPEAQLQVVKSAQAALEAQGEISDKQREIFKEIAEELLKDVTKPPQADDKGAEDEEPPRPTPKASDPLGDGFQLDRIHAVYKP